MGSHTDRILVVFSYQVQDFTQAKDKRGQVRASWKGAIPNELSRRVRQVQFTDFG